ncbi:unnamed protein product [Clonostachys rhizophaga]|uniref:Transcription factor domain-containing protein n=1 Tax=Clonostachys rhizophaga TaxID=160324 RepID=A0A9N9YDE8_9HYPO|nr:unnamed protein product [Clonostachys rhizophaga]
MMPGETEPRQYRFVGAYSRKRRRRNAPLGEGAEASHTQLRASTSASDIVTASAPTSKGTVEEQGGHTTRHSSPPPVTTCVLQVPPPLVEAALVVQEYAHSIDNILMPPILPPTEDANQLGPVDWSYSSFMNSSFDPSFSPAAVFDTPQDHAQVPTQLGIDVPPTSETPSSPDSSQDTVIYPETPSHGEPPSQPAESPGIALPLPNPQQIVCNNRVTVSDLVARYDKEFCVMPLTHDFDANPFRFDTKSYRNSKLLFHSILALSYKHINRETGSCADEARSYKTRALQMLHDTENASTGTALATTFLDALLIMMTLDCATSAHGPWTWYLKRAYKMMQATKSLNIEVTPRMRARMEMLVWWDVTLALTSRQGFVLPESAIVALFSQDKSKGETFYDVSGCPEALFRHMIRLGSYAREFELVSSMTCAKFDIEPVLEVEKQITEWRDPDYEDRPEQYDFTLSSEQICDIEAMAQYKEDLHHCAEAWRYCLLIYIGRVFRWQRDQPAQPILGFLARKTLRHVTCCRYTSQLQKQLLLPVFLAGCETNDEHLREAALSYCKWWSDKTKYDMFLTTHSLLQEFWSEDNHEPWWGSFLDKKTRSSDGSADSRQYLFG